MLTLKNFKFEEVKLKKKNNYSLRVFCQKVVGFAKLPHLAREASQGSLLSHGVELNVKMQTCVWVCQCVC